MNLNDPKTAWFETWFNTNYYHLLYANRDDKEAEFFVRSLINFLKPDKSEAHILDLACGKGRHSIFMNKLGYRVTGVDLSENSISNAKNHENSTLQFLVQDMREPLNQSFSHIFNLFTSFGYFDSIQDNERVMQAIEKMTVTGSIVVFDYFNAQKVVENLVGREEKIIEGVHFQISRKTDNNHVFKYIHVADGDAEYDFMERVQLLSLKDFEGLLRAINFEIIDTFGNFQLESFHAEYSDRLILIARKL